MIHSRSISTRYVFLHLLFLLLEISIGLADLCTQGITVDGACCATNCVMCCNRNCNMERLLNCGADEAMQCCGRLAAFMKRKGGRTCVSPTQTSCLLPADGEDADPEGANTKHIQFGILDPSKVAALEQAKEKREADKRAREDPSHIALREKREADKLARLNRPTPLRGENQAKKRPPSSPQLERIPTPAQRPGELCKVLDLGEVLRDVEEEFTQSTIYAERGGVSLERIRSSLGFIPDAYDFSVKSPTSELIWGARSIWAPDNCGAEEVVLKPSGCDRLCNRKMETITAGSKIPPIKCEPLHLFFFFQSHTARLICISIFLF